MSNTEVIKLIYSLLKTVQKDMFQSFFGSTGRKFCIHSSRRLGKTFLLVAISFIVSLSKANAQIRYASTSQKAVKKMIIPIFKIISSKIPKEFRPKWNQIDGVYIFPNGSQVHVAGVNNQHEDDLRGTAADLAIVDEAAFVDNLKYLIDSVLVPQLLTIPNAKLIMASSSPLSPAHEFVSYIQECKQTGNYSSYTIEDGGFDLETVEEFIAEAGGRNSTTCRREYFNELIVDAEFAIVPEYSKDLIGVYTKDGFDEYYHKYVSMDIGVKDLTAIIFATYNFKQAKLYIQDEIIINGNDVTTANIANLVKQKELELGCKPYRRISDNNNLILLQDLGSAFDLHFAPTSKDTLIAMVNELRLWVKDKRIIVDPKCKHVAGCLEFGVWDTNKKMWGKSLVYKHFDALAALMYLVRNIDQHTNPIPSQHGTSVFTHFTPPQNDHNNDEFKKIFNLTR